MIDKLLREALDTRIVNRFLGYQGGAEVVDRQVYALWNVLPVSYTHLDVYKRQVLEMDNRRILKVKFTVNAPAEPNSSSL